MLDVQLYGLNAGGHHLTNIIFHEFNVLMLFWLLRWLTGLSWPSAAVAALLPCIRCTSSRSPGWPSARTC